MAGPSPRKSVAGEARIIAARRLPNGQILQVRADGNRKGTADADSYPCARFIKGKFRAAVFTDEAMVPKYTD